MYSISNGIFAYCFFTVENSQNIGNQKMYEQCFTNNAQLETAFSIFTNVFSYKITKILS